MIQNGLRSFLSILPNKIFGSAIAEILGKIFFQKKLLTNMFESALDLEVTRDTCILLNDGEWVRIEELIKFPLIKLALEKVCFLQLFYRGSFLLLFAPPH